jgi:hypothetical protein
VAIVVEPRASGPHDRKMRVALLALTVALTLGAAGSSRPTAHRLCTKTLTGHGARAVWVVPCSSERDVGSS